uniref:Colicin import membrane protein n=1 Tax=Globodera pallida TaxID=36090 RepID=A0A183CND5_GLOPA
MSIGLICYILNVFFVEVIMPLLNLDAFITNIAAHSANNLVIKQTKSHLEQNHADNTFDVGKSSSQQAARINEQLIVLHRQPIKIPEGIIGNVLNNLSQQHTIAQPETAQTGLDEASRIAGRDEASAAARRDEALAAARRDEASEAARRDEASEAERRDEASAAARQDETSAAALGVRDEALINAGRDEA